LRKALKAPVESMCTSSTITTLKRSRAGRNWQRLLQAPYVVDVLLDAPSILEHVEVAASVISRQGSRSLQGSGVGPFSQSAPCEMRALVVLPTPRTPVKRNAWATRPCVIACRACALDVLLADQIAKSAAVLPRQHG